MFLIHFDSKCGKSRSILLKIDLPVPRLSWYHAIVIRNKVEIFVLDRQCRINYWRHRTPCSKYKHLSPIPARVGEPYRIAIDVFLLYPKPWSNAQ